MENYNQTLGGEISGYVHNDFNCPYVDAVIRKDFLETELKEILPKFITAVETQTRLIGEIKEDLNRLISVIWVTEKDVPVDDRHTETNDYKEDGI